MKNIIILNLLIGAIFPLTGHSQIFQEKLYQKYIAGKVDEWPVIIDEMVKSYNKTKNDRQLYNVLNAYYGYIGYCITFNKESLMYSYLEKGEEYIDFLIKKYPKWSEIYAMKSAWYGFRMSDAPYKAVYFGPKSFENINKAIELDKNSPFGYIEKANAEYHMPPVFGGSKQNALKYYRISILLFEKNNMVKSNWLYFNTLLNLAQTYEILDDLEGAMAVYKKILKLEPDFLLVKDMLYPQLLNRLKLKQQ